MPGWFIIENNMGICVPKAILDVKILENRDYNEVQEPTLEELLKGLDLDMPEEEPVQEPVHRKEKQESSAVRWQKNVLQYAHDLLYLLAILIVVSLLFRVVVVSGPSMRDTLQDGDYLLVLSNVFYKNPKQGDIVVASKDSFEGGAPIIKRVIATEGQWIDIDFTEGIVYVGDSLDRMQPLYEPYIRSLTTREEGVEFPLQVSDGCIFVMGDNRNNSTDSRSPMIGQIDKREVLGKAIFLFLPGISANTGSREFNRIGGVS